MIVRDSGDVKRCPVVWDGSSDPLRYDAATHSLAGLKEIPTGTYITCIGKDKRPWIQGPSFVGIDCLYEGKIVWFLIDTDSTRDPDKRPFGYDIIRIDA